MDRFETEEQQVEAIKTFWKENGVAIIVGAALGLGGLWGWRAYSDAVIESKETASSAYAQSIEQFVETQDATPLKTFLDANGETGYAPLATFIIAQQAVEAGDIDSAIDALTSVANGTDAIADIAKIRLAALQLESGSYEQALATVEGVAAMSFRDQVEELKGDIFVAQQDYDAAENAYNLALIELPNDMNIQMKLDNLAYERTLTDQEQEGTAESDDSEE